MKWFLFFVAVLALNICAAQNKWYVAAKNGLSIREKPDVKSTVIGKIPFATGVSIIYPDSVSNISVEGLTGAWAYVSHGGKSGFIINSYLLPEPSPKATVKTMKAYLQQ